MITLNDNIKTIIKDTCTTNDHFVIKREPLPLQLKKCAYWTVIICCVIVIGASILARYL